MIEKDQVDRNGIRAMPRFLAAHDVEPRHVSHPSRIHLIGSHYHRRKSPPIAMIRFSKGRHGRSSDNKRMFHRSSDLSARSTTRRSIDSGYRVQESNSLALSLSRSLADILDRMAFTSRASGFLGGEPFGVGRGQGLAPGRIYSWTVKNNV